MTIPFLVAIAILLGLSLFLFQEARRTYSMQWGRTPCRPRRIRVALAAILLALGVLAFWAFLIEPNRLVIRHETIHLDHWPNELRGLKIAVMADIHAGGAFIDETKLRTIVQRTNELQPGMVVNLGDYVSGNGWMSTRMEPETFSAILKDLHAPLGVYSVLGNHDWWYNGPRVRQALEANGIKVLDNEVIEVKDKNTSLWLAGLADLWTRPQYIDETISRVPQGQPVIALTHNPDVFPNLSSQVPLLIAGHTHGGQVRFPIIGTVIQPSEYGQRYVRGHVFENNHHLFVTTGIGTSIIPVRFMVPPEIVLLTIE